VVISDVTRSDGVCALGEKQTQNVIVKMSANDPKQTYELKLNLSEGSPCARTRSTGGAAQETAPPSGLEGGG